MFNYFTRIPSSEKRPSKIQGVRFLERGGGRVILSLLLSRSACAVRSLANDSRFSSFYARLCAHDVFARVRSRTTRNSRETADNNPRPRDRRETRAREIASTPISPREFNYSLAVPVISNEVNGDRYDRPTARGKQPVEEVRSNGNNRVRSARVFRHRDWHLFP